jgi:hypothetical protein
LVCPPSVRVRKRGVIGRSRVLPVITGDSIPEPLLLPPGLYEQVIDQLLDRRLAVSRGPDVEVSVDDIDAGDSHVVLADYLRHLVRDALSDVGGDDRLERQVELVNRIICVLAADPEGERLLPIPTRPSITSAAGP